MANLLLFCTTCQHSMKLYRKIPCMTTKIQQGVAIQQQQQQQEQQQNGRFTVLLKKNSLLKLPAKIQLNLAESFLAWPSTKI